MTPFSAATQLSQICTAHEFANAKRHGVIREPVLLQDESGRASVIGSPTRLQPVHVNEEGIILGPSCMHAPVLDAHATIGILLLFLNLGEKAAG